MPRGRSLMQAINRRPLPQAGSAMRASSGAVSSMVILAMSSHSGIGVKNCAISLSAVPSAS